MYKIYFKDKIIELSGSQRNIDSSEIVLEYESPDTFNYALQLIDEREEVQHVIIQNSDPEILLREFQKTFKIIQAAGGLVLNEKNELLIIKRHGRWDLPKGKLEENEDVRIGALREVEEECNVKNLSLMRELKITYHMYYLKGKPVLKKNWWFLMRCEGEQDLKPQTEESITEVKWFAADNLEPVFENTFPTIREVIGEYLLKFKGK